MNARAVRNVLGLSAIAAVAAAALSPGTALAWYNRQSSGYVAPQTYGYEPTPGEAYADTYGSTSAGYDETAGYGSSTPDYGYDSAAGSVGYTEPAYGSMQYPTPAEARAYTYGSPYAFAPSPRNMGY
jgi:hypothetical protein